MRILIYLLAMLTGFSAAEAARPVAAMPASVDTAVERAYADAAITVAKQMPVRPSATRSPLIVGSSAVSFVAAFRPIAPTTPVLRHDLVLG